MESRHEEVGQLADEAQGLPVQHMPDSTCNNSGLISEMDHSTQQETMKYTIGPDKAALENSIGEQLLLEERLEHTTVQTKKGNSSFQSSPKDGLGSISSHSGLGRRRDDLTTRDSKAPGKSISLEKPTCVQGRPDKEASKYSVVRTDQQGNYALSELGPACSCHASIELLNASNGKLQLHANGDVNKDLR
ncbi:unnamed protein product [Urochloa humidicola]